MRLATHGSFDWLLLDLHIPGKNPAHNLRTGREAFPHTPIVAFSGRGDPAHLRLALEFDVRGFIPKSAPTEVSEAALRPVGGWARPARSCAYAGACGPAGRAGGRRSRRRAVSLDQARGHRADRAPARGAAHVRRGAANQEIARDLDILPDTVKAHVAHLLMVLGASNRTHAVDLARRQGLL
jgi:DNA-binding NarL/FixJ family response regulator